MDRSAIYKIFIARQKLVRTNFTVIVENICNSKKRKHIYTKEKEKRNTLEHYRILLGYIL